MAPRETTSVTIYHNPRCSKSRQTLALLEERGIVPRVIEYLKEPPDAATLDELVGKLGIEAHELLRTKEAIYRELGLAQHLQDPRAIVQAMVEHPVLIERPIVVRGERARIGRPPEAVLELFD